MKLIKLLYFAERRALIEWGRPITFDWYFSMPHGPVLSFTLNKITGDPGPGESSYWHEYISAPKDYEVRLLHSAPNDQLSPAEEDVLDAIFGDFGHLNQWQLRDYAHEHLAEWQDPHGSSLPISIRDILLAEGMSDADVQDVEEGLAAEAFAERFAAE